MGEGALRRLHANFRYEAADLRQMAASAGCRMREDTEIQRMAHKYREILSCESRIEGTEKKDARIAKKCFKAKEFSEKAECLISNRSNELERAINRDVRRLEAGLAFSKIAGITASAILGIGGVAGGLALFPKEGGVDSGFLSGIASSFCFLAAFAAVPLGKWLVENAYQKAMDKARTIKDRIELRIAEAKQGIIHEIEGMKREVTASFK